MDLLQVDHMLGDHHGNNAQQFGSVVEGIGGIVQTVNTEGADNLVPFADGHTEIRKFLLGFAGVGAVQKQGFFTDLGNGDGLSALDDPSDDPLPQLVFPPGDGGFGKPVGHFEC